MNTNIDKYDFSAIVEDKNKKLILVIYDIIENKRRNRLVKLLESYGIRVQKSAFEVLISDKQYKEMCTMISTVISESDNVRLYRLNSSNEVILLGCSETAYEEEIIII